MKLPNTWDKFDINAYQSKNLTEAKKIKIGQQFNADGITWKVIKVGATQSRAEAITKSAKKKQGTYDNKTISKFVEGTLNEAPMDNRFAKDFERDCKVLITHVKHEMKTAKGADKSVFKKMLQNLQTVAGYPALIGKMVGEQ